MVKNVLCPLFRSVTGSGFAQMVIAYGLLKKFKEIKGLV